jgi:hypothetical protein
MWELGLRRDGPPLMTVLGDVYVNESDDVFAAYIGERGGEQRLSIP